MPLRRVHGPALVTNAAATKYTVPAGLRFILRRMHLSNPNTGPVAFTASIGADAAGTRIFDARAVAAGDVLDHYGPHVLEAGEIIQASCDVNNQATLTIDGELEAI